MKTLITTILILGSFNLFSKELSFVPKLKKDYVNAVTKSIPSYEKEMKDQVKKYVPVAHKIAQDLHISPDLVIAVIWTESHFKPKAESKVGAQGLMQIMPKTRKALIKEMKNYNLIVSKHLNSGLEYKEIEDLILGSYYLNKLMKRFNGDMKMAIIAYNMGPTWLSKKISKQEPVGHKNEYLNKVVGKMAIVASAE